MCPDVVYAVPLFEWLPVPLQLHVMKQVIKQNNTAISLAHYMPHFEPHLKPIYISVTMYGYL